MKSTHARTRSSVFLSLGSLISGICSLSLSACAAATHPQIQDQGFVLNHQPFWVQGVNYYPQDTPWSLFWTQFESETIAADLERVQTLGFNTIRIFVPFAQFGGAKVKPQYLEKLLKLLDLAEQNHLYVIVTLFDFYSDYDQIEPASRHLKTLLTGVGKHPALLAWDLKNEGDLDYQQNSARILNWLAEMSKIAHQTSPDQWITAGWASPDTVLDTAPFVDFLSFHYYGREQVLDAAIQKIQASSQQPLVMSEFGYHTWPQNPKDPHIPENQFNYFNAVLAASLKNQLAGQMVWALYDFPAKLREDWVLQSLSFQHYMGILGADSQIKPGAKALEQAVFVRDAQTHGPLSLESQVVELLFRQAEAGNVSLETWREDQIIATQSWPTQAGLNHFSWTLSPEQMRDLIYLKSHWKLRAEKVLALNGQVLANSEHLLHLRQK